MYESVVSPFKVGSEAVSVYHTGEVGMETLVFES
jgi:hypothetical protein